MMRTMCVCLVGRLNYSVEFIRKMLAIVDVVAVALRLIYIPNTTENSYFSRVLPEICIFFL